MPGSVQNAVPTAVLPLSLSRAFGHAREHIVVENEYRNGESQRSRLVETSRKRWGTARRLTPILLQSFRDFYDARKGPQEPFYFYDPWDARKARANLQKHGVSFAEAASVFFDPPSATGGDPDHSTDESRFVTFGLSSSGRLLVVAHAARGDAIRIISARRTTRAEREIYEGG